MPAVTGPIPSTIAALRALATPLAAYRVLPFGLPDLDDRLTG